MFENKEKMQKKSRPRLLGSKESMQTVSCPRLSGKVSAELTEGASLRRTVKGDFIQNGIKYLPVILGRSDGK